MSSAFVASLLMPELIGPQRLERAVEIATVAQTLVAERLPEAVWVTPVHGLARVSGVSPAALHATLDRLRHQCLSRCGVSLACGIASTRLAADIAARLVRPAGLLHVLAGYERRMLAEVSIRWLDGIDAPLLDRFVALGIRTLGEIAALDDDQLVSIAGPAGRVFARLARGDDPRPFPAAGAPRRVALMVDVGDASSRTRLRRATIVHLARSAAERGQRVDEVRLRVITRSGAGERFIGVRPPVRGGAWPAEDVADAAAAALDSACGDLPDAQQALVILLLAPPLPQLNVSRRAAGPGDGRMRVTPGRESGDHGRPQEGRADDRRHLA